MRVEVRVRPGASRAAVGGCYGEASSGPPSSLPALVVAVTERAVDGAATAAVVRAVSRAFGVKPRDVTVLKGATSRTKVLEVQVDPRLGAERLRALLGA